MCLFNRITVRAPVAEVQKSLDAIMKPVSGYDASVYATPKALAPGGLPHRLGDAKPAGIVSPMFNSLETHVFNTAPAYVR